MTINCVSDNFKSTNTGYNSFTVITGWYNHSLKYNSYETIVSSSKKFSLRCHSSFQMNFITERPQQPQENVMPTQVDFTLPH